MKKSKLLLIIISIIVSCLILGEILGFWSILTVLITYWTSYMITLFVITMFIWALIVKSNPKNIRGTVYYKDGIVIHTKVFPRFSDFEEYEQAMMENYGDVILKITWDYESTNSDKE